MSERELLELAAKAAGYEVLANKQAQRDKIGSGSAGLWIKGVSTCWNPRDDSGQALNFALRLGLSIVPNLKDGHVVVVATNYYVVKSFFVEPFGDDCDAAARLAIFSAAAEIGKATP